MEEQFQHLPLIEPSEEIRLLNLEPWSSDDDDIRCTLSVHRFEPSWINIGTGDAGFQYNAISYTWGDLTASKHIWVGTKRLSVTENCHYALWQARKHQSRYDTPIWIDAICINQHDDAEKSKQVAMMASIYACSSHTFMPFGAHADDSEFFCAYVASISPECVDVGPDERGYEGSGDEPDRGLESSVSFCKRPYWQRLWVVQELAFTNKGVCMCGEDVFDLELFQILVDLHVKSLRHHFYDESHLHLIYAHGADVSLINKIFEYRNTIKVRNSWIRSLWELISSFSHQICSDPRDRAFSLSGLQNPHQRLKPDYSLSRFELAKQVLIQAEFNDSLYDVEQSHLLGGIVKALELGFMDPDIQRLSSERLLPRNDNNPHVQPSSARPETLLPPQLTASYSIELHRNADGKFEGHSPYFGAATYECDDFPDCAEPLMYGTRRIGCLPQDVRDGDSLASYRFTFLQHPSSNLNNVQEDVHLVLRRSTEATNVTKGSWYEIVGPAITVPADFAHLGRSSGSFDFRFDIEDLLLSTTYIHSLGKAIGEERQELLTTMFSARFTREPGSSYAIWRPNQGCQGSKWPSPESI